MMHFLETHRKPPKTNCGSFQQVSRFFDNTLFFKKKGGPPLELINIQPPKRGSASRIHQYTAPQKTTASRIHQVEGSPPLEFINIHPPERGSASRIHQPKNGSPPLGTISMDLAVYICLLDFHRRGINET